MKKADYIGDGLYFEDDGYQIRLWTQRADGIHEVYLEESVLVRFLEALANSRGLFIQVRKQNSEITTDEVQNDDSQI